MKLTDYEFFKEQDELYISRKKEKWLIENVQTLRILLNHIEKNHEAQIERYGNQMLRPYYNNYKKMLSNKLEKIFSLKKKIKEHENLLIKSMLFYVDLPDDIKSYIGDYVDPLCCNYFIWE